MNASDIMRRSIASIGPAAPLIDAAQLLLETNQRALPVVDDAGRLIGIISEGDFLHRIELGSAFPARRSLVSIFRAGADRGEARQRMRALRVDQVMTRNPVVLDEEASLDDIVALMDEKRISQLPVVCGVVVVGIVSRAELLQVVERELRKEKPGDAAAPAVS